MGMNIIMGTGIITGTGMTTTPRKASDARLP